jgi:hypothetical protein
LGAKELFLLFKVFFLLGTRELSIKETFFGNGGRSVIEVAVVVMLLTFCKVNSKEIEDIL